jgi:DNA ligase-associated metallophosphoesterase
MQIEVAEQLLTLLPERAIWWEREKIVFLTDLHLGKNADCTAVDLERLSQLLTEFPVERLCLLGDLIHSTTAFLATVHAQLREWRESHRKLPITLIRGNHDERIGDPPRELRFDTVPEGLLLPPFVLRHYPTESPDGYTLAGHLHPSVVVPEWMPKTRLSCFSFRSGVGVLPAFGTAARRSKISRERDDRVIAVVDGELREVSG